MPVNEEKLAKHKLFTVPCNGPQYMSYLPSQSDVSDGRAQSCIAHVSSHATSPDGDPAPFPALGTHRYLNNTATLREDHGFRETSAVIAEVPAVHGPAQPSVRCSGLAGNSRPSWRGRVLGHCLPGLNPVRTPPEPESCPGSQVPSCRSRTIKPASEQGYQA